MVNFENGTLIKGAYVEINGVEYPVHMPQYEGETPLSKENMNKLQKDLQDEIKNEIHTGMDEVATNEWIDGKQVFRKRFDFGTLPNKNTKNLLTDLSVSAVNLIRVEGLATGTAGGNYYVLTLPDIHPGDYTQATRLTVNSENGFYRIAITTGLDRSNYNAFIDLYYTKNP